MSEIQTFHIKDEHIKLGQALKAAGLAESGVDAKYAVQDGLVKVNGAVELQRGKKLYGPVYFYQSVRRASAGKEAFSRRCGGISGKYAEDRVRAVNGYQITGAVQFQKFSAS